MASALPPLPRHVRALIRRPMALHVSVRVLREFREFRASDLSGFALRAQQHFKRIISGCGDVELTDLGR